MYVNVNEIYYSASCKHYWIAKSNIGALNVVMKMVSVDRKNMKS